MRLFVFSLFLFTATLLRAQDTLPVARLSGSIGPGIFREIVPLETSGVSFFPATGSHDSASIHKISPTYTLEFAALIGKKQRFELVGMAFAQRLSLSGIHSHYQHVTAPDSTFYGSEPLAWEMKMRAIGAGVNYTFVKRPHWETWGGLRAYYTWTSAKFFRGSGVCVQTGVRWKPIPFLSFDCTLNGQYLYPLKVIGNYDGSYVWQNASLRAWLFQAQFGISAYISNAPVDNRYAPEEYPQQ